MKKSLLVLLLFVCCLAHSFSQRISFQNFGVDRGLIQSQVQCFTQDKQRHLWIGTFGGLDRFDGTDFTHFTKSAGLLSSGITSLYTAVNGNIWAGHFKGISCFNGIQIINYPVTDTPGDYIFSSITEDEKGTIWAFSPGRGLFHLKEDRFIKLAPPADGLVLTCLVKNKNRYLEAIFTDGATYRFGISGWQKRTVNTFLLKGEAIIALIPADSLQYVLTSLKRVLKVKDNKLLAAATVTAENFGAFSTDRSMNIWVGTNKGVVVYNPDLSIAGRYNASNGLSDNFITDIFNDEEGNTWIGTDGDGIFRFSSSAFSRYDRSNGLPGNIVMGIVNNRKGQLYIGMREGGLIRYNAADKTMKRIDYQAHSSTGINCMGAAENGDLYIGTLDFKLLVYNGRNFRRIQFAEPGLQSVNSIVTRFNETWLATSAGCYYISGNNAIKIEGIDAICTSVLPINESETLIGSTSGLYITLNKTKAEKINHPKLLPADVNCLYRYKNYILAGTIDNGMYWWDRDQDKVYKCDAKSGLADDQVFSFFADQRNQLWVGTGTGLQLVSLNEKDKSFNIRKFSEADGYERSENNLNAIAADDEGNIWTGTTKGIFIYREEQESVIITAPFAVIQRVVSPGIRTDSSKQNATMAWYGLPLNPHIRYRNNSISITVKGILLRNPAAIKYSSMLEGFEDKFSEPSLQSFFNYQNLAPGRYTFMVRACSESGIMSENVATYTFTISAPFYKTRWFLILLALSLLGTGMLVHAGFNRLKEAKKKKLALLRIAEQDAIRQRTAEDFHDELGNKLTRISLLADILQKSGLKQDAESDSIIRQIKENSSALYTGTKEIIWSLSPGNNNLKQVMERIGQFGYELFSDTAVEFSITGTGLIDDAIALPMDYCRNLNMIANEILHNSLRHSGCTRASVEIQLLPGAAIRLLFRDNGCGADPGQMKKGNGLTNIQQRANRMHATVLMQTAPGNGMQIELELKIPPAIEQTA